MIREMSRKRIESLMREKASQEWEFDKCPFCESKDIGVKDNIIEYRMGHDCPCSALRKIWAYCRYCGAEGPKMTADVVYDDEIIAVALETWNKAKYWEEPKV